MKYITLGPFCWGKGDSTGTALINCVREYDNNKREGTIRFLTYRVTSETYINEMGGFNRPKGDEAPEKVEIREIPVQLIADFRLAVDDLLNTHI